jgi:glycine/D-amino acid oxidase-like deaminating enzyme/nitrite reductase/ring-hydroxylating ferredoxin subunit
MRDDDGQSLSVWTASTSAPSSPPMLTEHCGTEVCIVGAGIAGMTTAYMLARAGKQVVVLDGGPVGGGQTRQTTAHLSNAIDAGYAEIEKLHGLDGARLAAESHTAAIDRIESIAREERIACDFDRLDGYLFAPPEDDGGGLARELDAAHRAGLADVQMVPRAPLGCVDIGSCLRFPRQGQFHPLKYLNGLTRAVLRHGGRIFTGTHVTTLQGGSPARVRIAHDATVTADALVVATNTPINDRVTMHTKQAAYLTYAIGLGIARGAVTPALYWDTDDPYHYVRLHDGDVLIVGGEDHKTGQADDQPARYERLEAWTRRHFPAAGAVRYRWSGQVMETIDGLAFIGRNPGDDENVYVATGDSGMGITHGTIAGILLSDLILGRENPWQSVYDPSRKPLRAAAGFLGENLNVAKQFGAWLTPGDVPSEAEVARGTGAVVRHGLGKVAVYRDAEGVLHECSAVCPHLGCIVAWNPAEHTWDCPCHGSRFDARGRVLHGPANRDLAPLRAEGDAAQA